MPDKFRTRKPYYPDDSDYNTNAPSYYDDLARKTKLIQLLSKRIWEYDEILKTSLEEIENVLQEVINKIGEGFNQEIYDLLIQWVEDGTLDHIINEVLLNNKPEFYVSKDEPMTPFKNVYWLHDVGNSRIQTNIFKV